MALKFQHIQYFFQSIWTSILRTFVPQVTGLIVALLAKWGLDVDDGTVFLAVQQGFAILYYIAVRGLEEFKSSKWGKALGRAARPFYFDTQNVQIK